MKRLIAVLEIVYKKLTQQDWDNCLILTGDEGTGKSTLGLHILHWWLSKKNGTVNEKDIDYVSLDRKQFLKNLKECGKFDMPIYDESGDISNKRSLSGFNLAITKAYQIIRGDNLFTILILPSIFDLESFFTKRRARGLIHVYKRGRMAYWDKGRLRRLIALNQNKYIKSVWTVKPLFYDTFPKYTGVLSKSYLEKKTNKIKTVRSDLYKEIVEGQTNFLLQRNKLIVELANKEGTIYVAKLIGVSERIIQAIRKKAREENEPELAN